MPTLEETGARLGLTRERVRQLQANLEKRLAATQRPEEIAFAMAVAALEGTSTDVGDAAGTVLADLGLTDQPMSDKGVARLFALLGQSETFDQFQRGYGSASPLRHRAIALAKGFTRSVGVACVEWVSTETGTDREYLRRRLRAEGWCQFLDPDWFWDPSVPLGRNRLENITRKVLAACGPLPVYELREALDRSHRYGRLPHLPSAAALRLFYGAHLRFDIDEDDTVSSTQSLDPEVELDVSERALYLILKTAQGRVLDRSEFLRRAVAAGVNRNSFGVYSSYSPILDNPIQDCWVLRGSDVSPAVLEVARVPRPRRFRDEEWLPEGKLRVVRGLGQEWGIVVSLPRAYARLVSGRRFPASTQAGTPVGVIRFDAHATSWGYGRFLQDNGSQEGDVLVADFDLATGTCVLSLKRRNERDEIALEGSQGVEGSRA